MATLAFVLSVLLAATTASADAPASRPTTRRALMPPVVEGHWVRPADTTEPSGPVWGHADGLRIGLAPVPGPRGLLRVYAPHVGLEGHRVINYIAVEPVPVGANDRGYSELETSDLDHKPGKRFWTSEPADGGRKQCDSIHPSRGTIETVDGVEQLSAVVEVEPFHNGASVLLRLRFRADRPHEVGIAVFARDNSKPLKQCVITATMGNYARLRTLELADRNVHPFELWPTHHGDGFTPHAMFGLPSLKRDSTGAAYVSAIPNESDPIASQEAVETPTNWKYRGRLARQFWRMPNPPTDLQACVNGRVTYWASQSPIPGGIAFENFELIAPFEQGQEFCFGVDPIDAAEVTKANATADATRPK